MVVQIRMKSMDYDALIYQENIYDTLKGLTQAKIIKKCIRRGLLYFVVS